MAALRSAGVREVRADDHAAVLQVWSKHHRDLGQTRAQVVCGLHAVSREPVPGGDPKQLSPATQPAFWSPSSLRGCEPARWELAAEFPGDLRHIDAQPCQTRKKLAAAVRASGTSLTGLFGVGPVIAATVIGGAGEASRFPGRAHFAAYNGTAPMRLVDRMAFELLTARGNLPPQLIWVCPKKSSGSAQDMVKTIT